MLRDVCAMRTDNGSFTASGTLEPQGNITINHNYTWNLKLLVVPVKGIYELIL